MPQLLAFPSSLRPQLYPDAPSPVSVAHVHVGPYVPMLQSSLSVIRLLTQTLTSSLSSDSFLSFVPSNSISCCGLKAVRGETGCVTTGATGTTGNKILMNAFCISTLLIPLASII